MKAWFYADSWAEAVGFAVRDAQWSVEYLAGTAGAGRWLSVMRIYVCDNPLEAIVEGLGALEAGPARAFMVAALDRVPVELILRDIVCHAETDPVFYPEASRAELVDGLARWWTRAELVEASTSPELSSLARGRVLEAAGRR